MHNQPQTTMNLVGEKIDIEEIIRTSRDFNCIEFKQFLMMHGRPFWCWGAHAWLNLKNRGLRFMVSGLKHSGHVYVRCNGMDNLDVYFTTSQGTIKSIIEDIGIENVFEFMNETIEGR